MAQFDFEQFFSNDADLEQFKLDVREQITGIIQKKKIEEYHIEGTDISITITDYPVEIVSTMEFEDDSLSKETLSFLENVNHIIHAPKAKSLPAKFDVVVEETVFDPALEDFFNASTEDIKMCVNE